MEKAGRAYQATSFRNSGRRAGAGVLYDDYDEESCPGYTQYKRIDRTEVHFPNDKAKPEELNGPVICYKAREQRQTRSNLIEKKP